MSEKQIHPSLGPKLRWYRKQAELTLEALSRRSGVDKSQITRWERREETPNYHRACMVAEGLGIPVEWIWDHSKGPPETEA